MVDNIGYRIERLEKEFEKLRTEVKKDARTVNLEGLNKLADTAGFWFISVTLLLLDVVVHLLTLSWQKALAAMLIFGFLIIIVKIRKLHRRKP